MDPGSIKKCASCKEEKPISLFHIRKSGSPYSYCNTCENIKSRASYHKHRDKKIVAGKIWKLKARYNLTPEQYNNMLIKQNGVCYICQIESDKALHIDHCHETGTVRGLLCQSCNHGLGFFKDSVKLLERAIEYLRVY